MIDYIKYTVDGKTYELIDNGDGTWSRELEAPLVAGRYDLLLEISQNGLVTYIDSSDPRYEFYLDVIASAERVTYLENFVPDFIAKIREFEILYSTENIEFDKLRAIIEKIKSDVFIVTASSDAIGRMENFIHIKGQGNLEQRKSFLISLNRKGNKLNEESIKNIANAITGSDCIITFFASDELDNPEPGYGFLRIQVLSPDNNKDYKYEDIARVLKPLIPAHLKLSIIKYFATWGDIKFNFSDWNTVAAMPDWNAVKNYIPPQ